MVCNLDGNIRRDNSKSILYSANLTVGHWTNLEGITITYYIHNVDWISSTTLTCMVCNGDPLKIDPVSDRLVDRAIVWVSEESDGGVFVCNGVWPCLVCVDGFIH